MPSLVSIKKLSKNFGALTAVDGISFSADKGEVLGFLGPNGAGKTTTMRMITGYLASSGGRVEVCGLDVQENPIEVKKKIGYLPEGGPVYGEMTPISFLNFIAEARWLEGANRQKRIDFVIEQLNLEGVLYQNIETLSKGFKRRVALAQAIIHDPEVLILDEPTDGLDPNQKHQVRELIRSMAKDKAIVISTHILEEVEALCGRAIIIARGKIVASGSPDEIMLKAKGSSSVMVRLKKDSADKVLSEILKIKNVDKVKMEGKRSIIASSKGAKDILGDISNVLYKNQYQVEEMYSMKGTLDEAFRELTS